MLHKTIYDHVPDLETCLVLKQRGYIKQFETAFAWFRIDGQYRVLSWQWLECNYLDCEFVCAAPIIKCMPFANA